MMLRILQYTNGTKFVVLHYPKARLTEGIPIGDPRGRCWGSVNSTMVAVVSDNISIFYGG